MIDGLSLFQAVNLALNFGVIPVIALLWKMNNRILTLELTLEHVIADYKNITGRTPYRR